MILCVKLLFLCEKEMRYGLRRQPVALTSMRGHTKSSHGMSIGEYKEKHGNHRTQIIERVFHKCGLCGEVRPFVLLRDNISSFIFTPEAMPIPADNQQRSHKSVIGDKWVIWRKN